MAMKVLVVDDSMVMRTLISGVLERVPGVEVVGTADGADEARQLVTQLRPDVLTLDVEMPGMSGIEYLAEIMSSRPMPVIMFSTRTEEGAAESIEALRLGAIDCFPKPQTSTPAEFDKMLEKLAKRIKSAKDVDLKPAKKPAAAAEAGAASKLPPVPPMDWNGRPLMIGGDSSSTKAIFDLLEDFPENCPPTLVVQHLGKGLVDGMAEKLGESIHPKVVVAENGMAAEQGTIYLAPQGDAHMVLDKWPGGNIRLIPRDAVAGERPSISVLFASVAKAAGRDAVGLLLYKGENADGASGLRALGSTGSYAVGPSQDGPGFALSRGMASQPVASDKLAETVLKLCSK